ncbi:TIM barrel protein [Breoghania sp. L-A4]|uniref:hydroxypyruvate isomerase family protein n=1 Tax=Breoghania sp. L-A4 TaxID=2304600 RepID=UPI000E35EC5D|nr:TIM barrel protein [Breoghania sp. L-A4]AXS42410.1 isomerase [Breoghania sp. L-A4]
MLVANIAFLFTEVPFLERFDAARRAGFDAVECHWPYEHTHADLRAAIADSGLPLRGLNTWPGSSAAGEFGLAAVEGRGADFTQTLEQALDYAGALNIPMVHVMAGVPQDPARAEPLFIDNLRIAARRAAALKVTLLIEPINGRDVPGYALTHTDQAARIINAVGAENVMMMFDAYHVQITEGDVTRRFAKHQPLIGHVQIAAVPDRGEPDDGELCYPYLFRELDRLGYAGAIAAEYRPRGRTEDGLAWMAGLRAERELMGERA